MLVHDCLTSTLPTEPSPYSPEVKTFWTREPIWSWISALDCQPLMSFSVDFAFSWYSLWGTVLSFTLSHHRGQVSGVANKGPFYSHAWFPGSGDARRLSSTGLVHHALPPPWPPAQSRATQCSVLDILICLYGFVFSPSLSETLCPLLFCKKMQIPLDLESHLLLESQLPFKSLPISSESPSLRGMWPEGLEEAVHSGCTRPVLCCPTGFDSSTHVQYWGHQGTSLAMLSLSLRFRASPIVHSFASPGENIKHFLWLSNHFIQYTYYIFLKIMRNVKGRIHYLLIPTTLNRCWLPNEYSSY